MIRAAALTIVLTLAGTPAATAACLLWCGTPCPTSTTESASGVVTNPRTCAQSIVIAPVLREDDQRGKTRRALAHSDLAFSHAWLSAGIEVGRVIRVLARTEPPPGHQKPPTVLRI